MRCLTFYIKVAVCRIINGDTMRGRLRRVGIGLPRDVK
jgi:hypothetical protein